MLKFTPKIKMYEVDDGSEGGGNSPEPKTEQQPEPAQSASAPETQGDKFDDFGYPEEPEAKGDPKPKGEPEKKPEPPEAPAADDKVDPVTGYDKEPAVVVEPPAPPKEEPKVELDFEIDAKTIPDVEIAKIKQFAKSQGLNQKQTQEYLNIRKSEIAEVERQIVEAKKNQDKAIAAQKTKWFNELKADPTFGGEKFKHNVQQSEKVFDQFLPETKKALTASGQMLPPYLMRDLAKLGDRLFSTDKLVQGSPPAPPEKTEDKEVDPLDWYE